jgi:hypothetical protein
MGRWFWLLSVLFYVRKSFSSWFAFVLTYYVTPNVHTYIHRIEKESNNDRWKTIEHTLYFFRVTVHHEAGVVRNRMKEQTKGTRQTLIHFGNTCTLVQTQSLTHNAFPWENKKTTWNLVYRFRRWRGWSVILPYLDCHDAQHALSKIVSLLGSGRM